jgi:hypothetical protein
MKKMLWRREFFFGILFTIAFCFLSAGCANFQPNTMDSAVNIFQKEKKGRSPIYYNFEDVLIPGELNIDQKESFVFNSSGLSAGVLALNGGVEITSLVQFFEINMTKDNWKLISSFQSARTLMLFQKGMRWCVICIYDNPLRTHVEVWVAPS